MELRFEAFDPRLDFVEGEAVHVSLQSAEPGVPHVRAVWPVRARLPDGSVSVSGSKRIDEVPRPFRAAEALEEGGRLVWVGLQPYPEPYHPWGAVLCPQGELWVDGWRATQGEPVGPFLEIRRGPDELSFHVSATAQRLRGGAVGRIDDVRFVPPATGKAWRDVECELARTISVPDARDLSCARDGDEVEVKAILPDGCEQRWRARVSEAHAHLVAQVARAWRAWLTQGGSD